MGTVACIGGNGTGDALCGQGYQGPLCAVCAPGYILGEGSECVECASEGAIASLTVPLVVLSIVVALGSGRRVAAVRSDV